MSVPDPAFDALMHSPLFGKLDPEVLRRISCTFSRRRWLKGRVFSPGWGRESFHVIMNGRLELLRSNLRSGRGFTVSLLGPGDAFDLVALVDDHEHDVTPTAIDDLTVLSAPMAAARSWLRDISAFNRALLPQLSAQLRALEEVATDLAIHDTSTRLARLLVRHASDNELAANGGLINDLSNDAIARMIGSVRVVVNRHIQALKKAGAIRTQRCRLEIADLETLLAHCDLLATRGANQMEPSPPRLTAP